MQSETVEEPDGLQTEDSPAVGSPGLVLIFSGTTPYLLPIPLAPGATELGRDELLKLRIEDDRMSRRHVVVERDGAALNVRDLGSKNGVFCDGERLSAHAVRTVERGKTSVLRIGRTLFLLVEDIAPFQEALQRPLVQNEVVAGPTLHRVHKQVAALAGSGQGLFLRGESGSGKEITARIYHEASPRRGGPLAAVNCAAIPKELAERLLFGTVRGAYSGAATDAPGYLQAAHGGTLFLDEVAELDYAVQAKLLRVLETREVMPLGGTRAQPVDIRICAATLRDLHEAVAAGTFREDLYYRIGRPAVRLPPLRERLEEIPHLIHQAMSTVGKLAPSSTLIEACLLRPWPGNVRELCAEVRAAATLALAEGSEQVLPKHLSEQAGRRIEKAPASPSVTAPSKEPRRPVSGSFVGLPEAALRRASEALSLTPKTLIKLLPASVLSVHFAEDERLNLLPAERASRMRACATEALLALLDAKDYKQSDVAEALGTSRTTLLKLMEDLNLPRAGELTAEEIARARAQTGSDLDAAARLLRISVVALKKRMAQLGG